MDPLAPHDPIRVAPPQMTRKWTCRRARPGTAPTVAEVGTYTAKLKALLARQRQVVQAARKAKPRNESVPMLPNVLMAKAFDRPLAVRAVNPHERFAAKVRADCLRRHSARTVRADRSRGLAILAGAARGRFS